MGMCGSSPAGEDPAVVAQRLLVAEEQRLELLRLKAEIAAGERKLQEAEAALTGALGAMAAAETAVGALPKNVRPATASTSTCATPGPQQQAAPDVASSSPPSASPSPGIGDQTMSGIVRRCAGRIV